MIEQEWSWFWIAGWIIWAVVTLAWFGTYEYLSLKHKRDRRPPLTQVIQRFVPRWVFAVVMGGFFAWFWEHILG